MTLVVQSALLAVCTPQAGPMNGRRAGPCCASLCTRATPYVDNKYSIVSTISTDPATVWTRQAVQHALLPCNAVIRTPRWVVPTYARGRRGGRAVLCLYSYLQNFRLDYSVW